MRLRNDLQIREENTLFYEEITYLGGIYHEIYRNELRDYNFDFWTMQMAA